jgi:hypothetical protein
VVRLGDSHSSSQIFLGRPSWPHQTRYFAVMKSIDQRQDEHLVEAKELHQNNFQRSGRPYLKTLFLQKPWQSWRNVKDISVDPATQRVAGSAAKASFNASITLASSASVAVLTIGAVIYRYQFSMLAEEF